MCPAYFLQALGRALLTHPAALEEIPGDMPAKTLRPLRQQPRARPRVLKQGRAQARPSTPQNSRNAIFANLASLN